MGLSSFEDLAVEVAEARLTLAQAEERIKTLPLQDVAERLVEARSVLSRIPNRGPQVMWAFLELATAAALQTDSALQFLNFGINLGHFLCCSGPDQQAISRGLRILEQSLQQAYVVDLSPPEKVTVIIEVADAYLTHFSTMGTDHLKAAKEAYRCCLKLAENGEVSAELRARAHHGLGICLAEQFEQNRMVEADAAITQYRVALSLLDEQRNPEFYAHILHNMGNAWRHRLSGDHVNDLCQAADCLERALIVREKAESVGRFRITCKVLAEVELERGHIMRAINLLERSLESIHPIRERLSYARALSEMAALLRISKSMTLDSLHHMRSIAMAYYVAARDACDPKEDLDTWAAATAGLAAIWDEAIEGDRGITLRAELLDKLDPVAQAWRWPRVAMDQLQVLAVRAGSWYKSGYLKEAVEARRQIAELVASVSGTDLSPHRKLLAEATLARLDVELAGDSVTRKQAGLRELSLLKRALLECDSGTAGIELGVLERAALRAASDAGDTETIIRIARVALEREADFLSLKPTLAAYFDYVEESRSVRDSLVGALVSSGDLATAFREADEARGRVLDLVVAGRERFAQNPDSQVEVQVPKEFAARHAQLVDDWVANMDTWDIDAGLRRDALAPQLRQSLQDAAHWRGQWALAFPPKAEFPESFALDFADVPTALIEYWVTNAGSGAFVCLPSERSPRLVRLPGLTRRQVMDWASQWYEAYSTYERYGSAAILQWSRLMMRITAEIGETCWQPLRHLVESRPIQRVVLVPDGLMDGLPLQSMALGKDANGSISDQYDIVFSPSTRHLARAMRHGGVVGGRALFLGNAQAECPTGTCRGLCDLALPQAEAELAALRLFWPSVQVLMGTACNKTAVLNELEKGHPGLIHASLHGITRFQDPLASGLILAAKDRFSRDPLAVYVRHELTQVFGDETAGEVLTLDTLLRLDGLSSCKLAFLNACETGLSSISRPSESLSVAMGLLGAGVPTVIAPVWPVADAVCGLISEQFYRELKTQPDRKGHALASAQRWLRSLHHDMVQDVIPKTDIDFACQISGSERPFSHMFYWAPLRLLGSPL